MMQDLNDRIDWLVDLKLVSDPLVGQQWLRSDRLQSRESQYRPDH